MSKMHPAGAKTLFFSILLIQTLCNGETYQSSEPEDPNHGLVTRAAPPKPCSIPSFAGLNYKKPVPGLTGADCASGGELSRGKSCTVSCANGFSATSTSSPTATYTCSATGALSLSVPKGSRSAARPVCVAVPRSCGLPAFATKSNYAGSTGNCESGGRLKPGESCTVQCTAGFAPTNTKTTGGTFACSTKGKLTVPSLTCIPKGCADSERAASVGWVCSKPSTNGQFPDSTKCTLACPKGTSGPYAFSTCNQGTWTAAVSQCTNNPCDATQRSSAAGWQCSATPTANGKLPDGAACRLVCPTGTSSPPNQVSTCSKGVWTGSAAQCTNDPCPASERLAANGWACDRLPVNGMLADGSRCTIGCFRGAGGPSAQSTCAKGKWTAYKMPNCAPGAPESCDATQWVSSSGWNCDSLPVGDMMAHGTECRTAECPSGSFGSSAVSTCNDGQWDSYTCPVCTACPVGCVTCSSATSCGTCEPGYHGGEGAPCVKCHESCQDCESADSCTACPASRPLMYGGLCFAQCPGGRVPEDGQCQEMCDTLERPSAFGWACGAVADADGNVPHRTECTMNVCPPGTRGRPVSSTCLNGAWTIIDSDVTCTNAPCNIRERPSEQGWECDTTTTTADLVNGALAVHGTMCTRTVCPGGTSGPKAWSSCAKGAWTSEIVPVCTEDPCMASQRPVTSGWVCNTTAVNGTFSHLTECTKAVCSSGTSGVRSSSVCDKGVWRTPTTPICTEDPCPASERLASLGWLCSATAVSGTHAHGTNCTKLVCPAGTSGLNATSACDKGMWTEATVPVCTNKPCAASQWPVSLGWTCNATAVNGTLADGTECTKAVCASGTSGPRASSRCSRGNWTAATTPTCTNDPCPASQWPTSLGWACNATAVNGTLPDATECTKAVCASGTSGPRASSLCSRGTWTAATTPTCTNSPCVASQWPSSEGWTCNATAVSGTLADGTECTKAVCASGTSGPRASSLCSRGSWTTATTPTCTNDPCDAASRSVTSGWACSEAAVDNKVPDGTDCVFMCPSGTSGPTVFSSCTTGVWSPAQTQCVPDPCGVDIRPASAGWVCSKAAVDGKMPDGTICYVQCPAGTTGPSNQFSTCKTGTWSGSAAQCTENPCPASQRQSIGGWTCNSPAAGDTMPSGTQCTSNTTCPTGTSAFSTTSVCYRGQWATDIPPCINNPCAASERPPELGWSCNTTILNAMLLDGTECKKNCTVGFSGTFETTVCQKGVWTAPTSPQRCTRLCPGASLCRALTTATTNCSVIYAYNNTLVRYLEDNVSGCTSLALAGKSLNAVADAAFWGMSGLTQLDLSSNSLSTLNSRTLSGQLVKLQTLYLHSNLFGAIDSSMWAGLRGNCLTYLSLAYNRISALSSGAFAGLVQLRALYLNSNSITALNSSMWAAGFEGSLTSLSLGSNTAIDTVKSTSAFAPLTALSSLNLDYCSSSVTCSWAQSTSGGGARSSATCSAATTTTSSGGFKIYPGGAGTYGYGPPGGIMFGRR